MKKKKNLDIVMVTTEIVPYSKVGGLADVMGALPDALEELGCTISIFTPLYSSIDRKSFGVRPVAGAGGLEVPVGDSKENFRVCNAVKPGTGIKVYFIDSDNFYGREGIYTEPETGKAFDDEAERTIFFNRAVVAAMKECNLHPDVIHCNDFHTGLIPAYLEMEEKGDPHFENAGTVFSVHNLAYQGSFERDFIKKAGIDPSLFRPLSPYEFWGKVNVMKIGLSYAKKISTVSRTYAREITTTEEYGYGLEGVLRFREDDLVGILNGIDQEIWNPETDELIPFTYSSGDMRGKTKNRTALLKEFGLPPRSRAPVFGIVSRLVDQKGFDIFAEAAERLMKLDAKYVILGTGQQKYHELYGKLAKKYPKTLGLKLEFNNRLAHLIEAGSDFFLMPSRYEPCGLNQMYSLRYGTIPVVRATGGLKDTISNLNRRGTKGNGFTFVGYTAKELAGAVERAVAFFADVDAVDATRRRIMDEDHSWLKSARDYIKLYKSAREAVAIGS
jgi:starch synthase